MKLCVQPVPASDGECASWISSPNICRLPPGVIRGDRHPQTAVIISCQSFWHIFSRRVVVALSFEKNREWESNMMEQFFNRRKILTHCPILEEHLIVLLQHHQTPSLLTQCSTPYFFLRCKILFSTIFHHLRTRYSTCHGMKNYYSNNSYKCQHQ